MSKKMTRKEKVAASETKEIKKEVDMSESHAKKVVLSEGERSILNDIKAFHEELKKMDFSHEGMTSAAQLWRVLGRGLTSIDANILMDAWSYLNREQSEKALKSLSTAIEVVTARVSSRKVFKS